MYVSYGGTLGRGYGAQSGARCCAYLHRYGEARDGHHGLGNHHSTLNWYCQTSVNHQTVCWTAKAAALAGKRDRERGPYMRQNSVNGLHAKSTAPTALAS